MYLQNYLELSFSVNVIVRFMWVRLRRFLTVRGDYRDQVWYVSVVLLCTLMQYQGNIDIIEHNVNIFIEVPNLLDFS
jgi:hypothetical protein